MRDATSRKPLRLWPGVVGGVLLLIRFILPTIVPEAAMFAALGGVVGALVVVLWWLFFSRAPWSERLGVLALIIVALLATSRVIHISIAGGMMGLMFPVFALQTVSLALIAWAVASRGLSDGPRRALLVVAILIGCGVLTLLRTDGLMGGRSLLAWRWMPTAEERLLAQTGNEPMPPPPAPAATTPEKLPDTKIVPPTAPTAPGGVGASAAVPQFDPAASKPNAAAPAMSEPGVRRVEWDGFRGPNRDSVVRGVRIETDWSKSPPVEMWRRAIGPGWSSFAVGGDRIYTQEQRGNDEIVACYSLATGKPVWMHRDATRFWESNAGAGPRGTPTLHNGRVYSFGATGLLNALDAGTGAVVWMRNAAAETSAETPTWGFSSSPLVVDDLVIVSAGGTLAAYDLATGKPRWTGPKHSGNYSSPHLATIDGVAQILLQSFPGVISVAPADGKLLWEHTWEGGSIVQPAVLGDGDILTTGLAMTGGTGMRRLSVKHGSGGWTFSERWTSNGLKPYFSDFVVHKGHAFGFDGSILASLDLADGKRKWKGGRYGEGQLILLADQDVLLVLSEEGELALVSATPDKFTEIARAPAIEGKTWNHPVLVGNILLVRNGEEMAAFRLAIN
jgi:outer membrane protein assembly factor BamB